MSEKFDQVLTELETGKWNLMYFVSSSLIYLLFVPLYMSSPFVTPPLNHTCTEPSPAGRLSSFSNISLANSTASDQCHVEILSDEGNLVTTKCTAWAYDNSTFSSTATSEFNMVCDNAYQRVLFRSIMSFGSLFGDPLSGFLCDSLGRKKPTSVLLVITLVVSVIVCWVPDITVLMVCRFLIGVTTPLVTHGFYTLTMEVCEPKYRSIVGILVAMPWAFGVMAWGGIGYLIRDWRWLLFSTILPCTFFVILLFLWDESPRWLIVKGRHMEALKILQKASRWNKSTLPSDEELLMRMREIEHESREEKMAEEKEVHSMTKMIRSFTILYRTPEMRKISLLACLDFTIVSMVYGGLSLYGMVLNVNTYLYMVITGLMEVPAYAIAAPVIAWFGRRAPSVVGLFVSAVSLLSVPFIPDEVGWLVIAMTMIGKFCISGVFMILYLYFLELYPTEVRGRGLGTSFLVANVGVIIVPYIIDVLGSQVAWVPSVIFGIMTVAAAVATMFLRETLHHPLYETVDALEHDSRRRKKKSKKASTKSAEEELQLQA